MENIGRESAGVCPRRCQGDPESRKDDTCQKLRATKSCIQLLATSEADRESKSSGICPTNPDEGATIIGQCGAEFDANKCAIIGLDVENDSAAVGGSSRQETVQSPQSPQTNAEWFALCQK